MKLDDQSVVEEKKILAYVKVMHDTGYSPTILSIASVCKEKAGNLIPIIPSHVWQSLKSFLDEKINHHKLTCCYVFEELDLKAKTDLTFRRSFASVSQNEGDSELTTKLGNGWKSQKSAISLYWLI